MTRSAASIALVLAVLAAGPATARAAEGERAVSVQLGFATFDLDEINPAGTALELTYEYGISEALAVRVLGGGGVYFGDERSYSGQATASLRYALDVLKYVPYATIGAGAMVVGGEPDLGVHPVISVGGGLDVLHSRSLSYGAYARLESFAGGLTFFTVGARAAWRWGFF
jgi:hypothetical protein